MALDKIRAIARRTAAIGILAIVTGIAIWMGPSSESRIGGTRMDLSSVRVDYLYGRRIAEVQGLHGSAADYVSRAVRYLERSIEARRVLACLRGHDLRVLVNAYGQDFFKADSDGSGTGVGGTMIIEWDPMQGVASGRGARMSPSVALAHELGHACGWLKDPEKEENRLETQDAIYDNAEERRVILDIEQPIERELGEDVRLQHRGRFYAVDSPTQR